MSTSIFDQGWLEIGEFFAAVIFFFLIKYLLGRDGEPLDDSDRT